MKVSNTHPHLHKIPETLFKKFVIAPDFYELFKRPGEIIKFSRLVKYRLDHPETVNHQERKHDAAEVFPDFFDEVPLVSCHGNAPQGKHGVQKKFEMDSIRNLTAQATNGARIKRNITANAMAKYHSFLIIHSRITGPHPL